MLISFSDYVIGADPEARPYSTDTVMQCQGERGLVEMVFPAPGNICSTRIKVNSRSLAGWGFFEAE